MALDVSLADAPTATTLEFFDHLSADLPTLVPPPGHSTLIPSSGELFTAPQEQPTTVIPALPPPCPDTPTSPGAPWPGDMSDLTPPCVPPGPVDAPRRSGSMHDLSDMSDRPSLPSATWSPGAVIPGTVYRVIRPLGVGGMGEVYEAEHELLGVRRALKVLSRRLASREDLAERLRIEARALARLRHPNLVEVSDLGVASDGRVFFAMELLAGATLRDLLQRTGGLRIDQAIVICAQVLDALDAAHQEGMIHRDVKPENVFMQRSGVVKLLDFGVAKALQGNTQLGPLTAAGVAIGTPRYMAPEQAQGQSVDARTDVYAVGLLLWEMLTGKLPYSQLDPLAAVVTAAAQGLPDITEATGVTVPPELKGVLARATARLPADRYRSAAAFASDLRKLRGPIDAPPASGDKITVRYENSLTSLMPILGDMPGDTERTSVDGTPASLSAITRSSLTSPDDLGTAPTQEAPSARTEELRLTEPLEAHLLRGSLPFDQRSQPTPTSIPPVAPRASQPPPALAAPTPVPPSRAPLWAALPLVMLVSVVVTWWVVRPSAPAPIPVAPALSVAPAVSAATPATSLAVTSASAPPVASIAAPPSSAVLADAAPPAETTRPATTTRPGAKPPAGKSPPRPAGRRNDLPGSGL